MVSLWGVRTMTTKFTLTARNTHHLRGRLFMCVILKSRNQHEWTNENWWTHTASGNAGFSDSFPNVEVMYRRPAVIKVSAKSTSIAKHASASQLYCQLVCLF